MVEVNNRAALALPPPKPCPNEMCSTQCIYACYWQKEKPPNKIDFNEIYLNQQETREKKLLYRDTFKIFPKRTIKNIYTID